MKALIVDDELHCRNVVTKMAALHCPEITEMIEAIDVQSGLERIIKDKPDIVFLDIQLNELTGFDLLEQLDTLDFQLVFTTAYDNFAVQAFDYAAVHYLLKPIAPSDLKEAVSRCEKKELNYEKDKINDAQGFYLKTHDNSYNLIYDQIKYLKADGSYSTIYTENDKSIFTSKKLADYGEILNEDFYRIHHSIIVNMNFVEKLDKKGANVALKDETILPLSRRKKADFKKALTNFRNKK